MERSRAFQEKRRLSVEAERERLALAREIALGSTEFPSLPLAKATEPWDRPKAERDQESLRSYVAEFEAYKKRVGDLERVTWIAAHLNQYVFRYQEGERANGLAPTQAEDLRRRRAQELEPIQIDGTKNLGLHLGQTLMELIDSPVEVPRWPEDWWEIAVAALLLGDLHGSQADLGISHALLEREWKKTGAWEDLFSHREGLLDFAFVNPDHGERERARWDRMWLLAARAATLLGDEAFAPEVEATAAHQSAAAGLDAATRPEPVHEGTTDDAPVPPSVTAYQAAKINPAGQAVLLVLEEARRAVPPRALSAGEIRSESGKHGLHHFGADDPVRRTIYALRKAKWPIDNPRNGTGYVLGAPLSELCPDLLQRLPSHRPPIDHQSTQ